MSKGRPQLFAGLICLGLLLIWYCQESTMTEEQFIEAFYRQYGRTRIIGNQCVDGVIDKADKVCLRVEDTVEEAEARVPGKKIYGLRKLVDSPFSSLSKAYIEFPEKLVKSNLDSTHWNVAKYKIDTKSYTSLVISSMFDTGLFPLLKNVEGRIALMGLGGGSLNNFIDVVFPKIDITAVEVLPEMVDIAKKYYNVQPSHKHHVVAADGVEFLKKEAASGVRYDMIIVDSSNNVFRDNAVVAPFESFLYNETIIAYKQLLQDTGVLVYNILILGQDNFVARKEKEILASHSVAFTQCLYDNSIIYSYNKVLICTNRKLPANRASIKKEVTKFLHSLY